MPGEVTVIATLTAKPGEEERVLEIVERLVTASQGDDGCVRYTLHRATNEPGTFSIVEVWRSQEDLDAHFGQPHMAAIGEAVEMLTEPPRILFCEPVAVGDPEKGTLGR